MEITGDTSDGYHTFNELYHARMVLNALLFNEWHSWGIYETHKSKLHHDGTFIEGYFVVMAHTPKGQISFHYKLEDWDKFNIEERPSAVEWDGHDSAEAARRMDELALHPPELMVEELTHEHLSGILKDEVEAFLEVEEILHPNNGVKIPEPDVDRIVTQLTMMLLDNCNIFAKPGVMSLENPK